MSTFFKVAMRHFFVVLFLTMSAPEVVGGERKPNTLTPEEAHDGWLLLFDGESVFGWHSLGAKVTDGTLQLAKDVSCTSTGRFADYQVHFEFSGQQGQFFDKRKSYESGLALIAHYPWEKVIIRRAGGVVAWDFPARKFGPSKNRDIGRGPATIGFRHKQGKPLLLRDIKLRPLTTVSLFNGKDLTGWKIFPGKKSKFTVEDGATTIQNGPGDLQTEGKYKDFILQLECKTNGKHLNSGVFFRCREGEYQNGYEAQIRNQFTAEPKQVYTLEEYDPKTHRLIDKKKVKYAAVDYGTGAIYRRQPARREVAKDGDWFTMTILAHGHHFATWVNGIQVTDWTDNRPPSDNARTGFRREAGHISLQGHDPTTNLSFRNIRIAELK